jgi:hypothetical protein
MCKSQQSYKQSESSLQFTYSTLFEYIFSLHSVCDYCFRLDQYLSVDLPADGPLLPFCTHTFSLDFSMHTFEHLHVSKGFCFLSLQLSIHFAVHVTCRLSYPVAYTFLEIITVYNCWHSAQDNVEFYQ